ncbi:winged helix-turn-helix domain-containing protein [Actinoplanes sp. TRM 88003]|uniref:Winged helix-turn-helix domain-containing protein n=1 Tax=Paractinoplanes aksuensis TaxID=2939490 RepID=A0ABT1DTZ5_9ACTN|nr:BTAD domain-containing putative transcriptional regulator [Actinoplanes aksuensis]MCO8274314.1 winged helix-turn-helix domain-containing protein [Actinoplanes aksuensis]
MDDHARISLLTAEKPCSLLAVHVLGPFLVTLDGVPAGLWHGGRNESLFAYLLTHRNPWPSRETLMHAFWPDSTPEAARNSLNVALHGLRRALRTVTDRPIIVLRGNRYGLDPAVRLWLDVDEFDRHLRQARRFHLAGESDAAVREYEVADGLYRGDLLAESPYEEWPLLPREQWRLAHIDALDHLSSLSFAAGRYAAAAGLSARVVEGDPCREATHRRLMVCHSRQGQPHLALIQHRVCAAALWRDLGVEPSPETQDLYQRIRRHEPV